MKRRNKIILWILGIFLFILVAGYTWLFHIGGIEYIANRQIHGLLGKDLPLKIHIGEIGGDFFANVLIKDISVVYEGEDYEYEMAYVPELLIEFSLKLLWKGQLIFKHILIDSGRFTIKQSEEGEWLIPKGDGGKEGSDDGLLEFEIQQIDLNDLKITIVKNSDSLIFRELFFSAAIQAQEETYSANIKGFRVKSSDDRFNMVSPHGKITFSQQILMFHDLAIKTDSSNLDLQGNINFGENFSARVEIDAENINVAELSDFIDVGLAGNLKVDGSVSYQQNRLNVDALFMGKFLGKPFDSLYTQFALIGDTIRFDTIKGVLLRGTDIDGKGFINFATTPPSYHIDGKINNFNLNNLVENTLQTDINGIVDIDGESFDPEELNFEILARLGESKIEDYRADSVIGNIMVTIDSVLFRDSFLVKYADNKFTLNGKLEYDGPLYVNGTAEFNDLSAFNDQIFIETMGGRGTARVIAQGDYTDPDISGWFRSDSVWIYEVFSDSAEAIFDIDQFLYNRQGTMNISMKELSVYGKPVDSIYSDLSIDTQFVTIDSFRADMEHGWAVGSGDLNYAGYPQTLKLDTLTADILSLDINSLQEMVLYIDTTGYEFERIRISHGRGNLSANGRINSDNSFSIRVLADSLDIMPLTALYNDEYELGGYMSAETYVWGNYENPLIDFQGLIDSMHFEGLHLGDLVADLDYKNKLLTIDSAYLSSEHGHYSATGTFPVDLAFTQVENRLPDQPMDISIAIEDKRLDLVSLMMTTVEDFAGDFKGNIDITGTPDNPNLNGRAQIRNGYLKIFELENPLENLYIDLGMTDNVLNLDSVYAISGKNGGKLYSHGRVKILALDTIDYDLDLTLNTFPVRYTLGDISATADATLSIEGHTPPLISGDINVIRARYRENFAGAGTAGMMSGMGEDIAWIMNLDIRAKNNFWIENDDIDAEFSADINFIREVDEFRVIGQMEILRGKAFLPGMTFRLEPGSRIIFDNVGEFNPRLDIIASTKARQFESDPADPNKGQWVTKTVKIHVTGTLDEPNINPVEGSEYTRQELITMLFPYFQGGGTGEFTAGSTLSTGLTGLAGIISSQLSQFGARTLGVETFEIDPGYGQEFDPLETRVTLGFYTHPDLYVYGRSSLSMESGREVGFEYRLEEFLIMEGEINENNLYQLFFNFHWEY